MKIHGLHQFIFRTATIFMIQISEIASNALHPAAIVETGSRAISSDRNIFDGSLRLKNINLGYNFELSDNKNLRVYLSAQNLFVWTDYPGYDPEVRTHTKKSTETESIFVHIQELSLI